MELEWLGFVENGTCASGPVSKPLPRLAICTFHFSFFNFHFAMLFPE